LSLDSIEGSIQCRGGRSLNVRGLSDTNGGRGEIELWGQFLRRNASARSRCGSLPFTDALCEPTVTLSGMLEPTNGGTTKCSPAGVPADSGDEICIAPCASLAPVPASDAGDARAINPA